MGRISLRDYARGLNVKEKKGNSFSNERELFFLLLAPWGAGLLSPSSASNAQLALSFQSDSGKLKGQPFLLRYHSSMTVISRATSFKGDSLNEGDIIPSGISPSSEAKVKPR
jgi:hypothetical protein